MSKLNTVMGYALSGVRTRLDRTINDPRINSESPLLAWSDEDTNISAPTLADYREWLKIKGPFGAFEVRALDSATQWSPHNLELIHTLVHEPEAGWPDTLVLVPPAELGRWIRRGNLMDTALATARGTELEVEVLHLETGPESVEKFMDRATGARVDVYGHALRLMADDPDSHNELAVDLGYADASDAAWSIVPAVPSSILRLAEFADLFTGPDVWKELRPVVYTYWA